MKAAFSDEPISSLETAFFIACCALPEVSLKETSVQSGEPMVGDLSL